MVENKFVTNLQELDKLQSKDEKQKKQTSIIKNIIVAGNDNMKSKLKMIDKVNFDY